MNAEPGSVEGSLELPANAQGHHHRLVPVGGGPMTAAVIGFPPNRCGAGGTRRDFQQYALPSGREPGSPRCTLSEESI